MYNTKPVWKFHIVWLLNLKFVFNVSYLFIIFINIDIGRK